MKLEDIRREYIQGGLSREMLDENPIAQFEKWLAQAVEAKFSADPTAMVVATVDDEGQPSQRIVLLKQLDNNGFVFFHQYWFKKSARPQCK